MESNRACGGSGCRNDFNRVNTRIDMNGGDAGAITRRGTHGLVDRGVPAAGDWGCGVTPTQRSLKHVRDLGWEAQVVEKWQVIPKHPAGGVRIDLFGVIDILCLVPNRGGVTGIQTTSGSNSAARRAKIEAEPRMIRWCRAGNSLEIHAWAKRGARGKRKLWTCRVVEARVVEHYGSEPKLEWLETQ